MESGNSPVSSTEDRALHYSDGKPAVDQIPPEVLLSIGTIYTYGSKKYGKHNWRKGTFWSEFYGSGLRHLFKWWSGEEIDEESGCDHLDHALWNFITLRYYRLRKKGIDDRDLDRDYRVGLEFTDE
jgi:hypothetical protein